MLICPINLNVRLPFAIAVAVAVALLMDRLLVDPAILFLAPFAIPALIWHRTRCTWLAADRSMRCLPGPRLQRSKQSIGRSRPRSFKRHALRSAPIGQKRRQILVVRYRKEIR